MQYVVNRNPSEIRIGVPRGSVLGPLSCFVYINDFSTSSKLIQFLMYADDAAEKKTSENKYMSCISFSYMLWLNKYKQ